MDNITTIETDTLWAPLDFAAFNTNIVFMVLYKKKLNTYATELPDNLAHVTTVESLQITQKEPGGDNADLTSPIPSSKTSLIHPHDNNLNGVPIMGPPASKECTTTTATLQTSQQGTIIRPLRKPPDDL